MSRGGGALALVVGLGTLSCADVKLRGEDSTAIWNFSPSQPLEQVGSPLVDPALPVCCPREGGDLLIEMMVSERGMILGPRIARPSGLTGVAAGLACVAMSAVIWLEGDDVDGGTRADNESMMLSCKEGEERFGGSYFFPPPIPEATKRCVERMMSSKSIDGKLITTPAHVELRCPKNPVR